jgi:hypothetical protein
MGAARPKAVTIDFSLMLTGPNTAEGTFTSAGAIEDSGGAAQEFTVSPPEGLPRTVHGIKTLMGAHGTITIEFNARVIPTSPTTSIATGRFTVLYGTGDYEGLSATGRTYAELDFMAGTIDGSYIGFVH